MMLPPRPPDDPRHVPVRLRRELLTQGYDDNALAALVRSGELVRVRRGAYLDGDAWNRLDAAGRYGARVRAAAANARAHVVVSHVSGLPEFDAPLWGLDLSEVHLTRRDARAGRADAGVRQHCGTIEPDDVVNPHGLEVMHPTRLALELTTIASVESALCVVNDLLHRELTTMDALRQRMERMQHWPRSLTTDIVLSLARPEIESVGETRTFHLCRRFGLPMPTPQFEIRDASGRVIHRVDLAWPEYGVFLEFDGRVKYEKYLREGERASDVVIREKKREELICRLTGWRCIRIDWNDLAHPERTAALIRAVLFASAA